MAATHKYKLCISGLQAGTTPMQRVAKYLDSWSRLLRESDGVHFCGVEAGSMALLADVEPAAHSRIQPRLQKVSQGMGDKQTHKVFEAMNMLLHEDNTTAEMKSDEAVILQFPGAPAKKLESVHITEEDTVAGQVEGVYAVVKLRGFDVVDAHCSLEMAARIAACPKGRTLRARGQATRHGRPDGSWRMEGFEIADFSLLEDKPLTGIFDEMRKFQSGAFRDIPDPVQAVLDYRHGGKKP